VTGLEVRRLFADLGTVVEGRRMEDDATVILELDGGVRGVLLASQIATGARNHLRLRVYGTEGALDWCQEDPERLTLAAPDGTETVLHRGGEGLALRTRAHTRLPGGHPEGFIEAFANVYRNVARSIHLRDLGTSLSDRAQGGSIGDVGHAADFPTVQDGAAGVHFIHAALESARRGAWVDADYTPPDDMGYPLPEDDA
jgi:predicted dehydrogenase